MSPIRWIIHKLLVGGRYWIRNCVTGTRCHAAGCGRLLLFHAPWQSYRCNRTPLAIELTDKGWLYGNGIEPESVYRKTS